MKKLSTVLLIMVVGISIMGCASRTLIDEKSGIKIKSSVPIFSTKSALSGFTMKTDPNNGIQEITVTGFKQENTESIESMIGTGLGAALKAYQTSQGQGALVPNP